MRRGGYQLFSRNAVSAEVTARHLPSPWSVDDLSACFVVKDGSGQELAYVYYQEHAGRRAVAKLLTRDEAWRVALGIAKNSGIAATIILTRFSNRCRCRMTSRQRTVERKLEIDIWLAVRRGRV